MIRQTPLAPWMALLFRACLAVGLAAALAAWSLQAGSCWGQAAPAGGWKQLKEYKAADGRVAKIPKQPKLKRFRIQEILRAGKVPPADEPAFDEYFMYIVAEFTMETNRARLAELRDQLKRYYLQEAGKEGGGTELHDRLVQLMLAQFLPIALDEGYAPPVRYNAILVVGDLNLREGTPPSREDFVPLPQALPPLLEVAGNARHPHYLRVGALVGIERHLRSRDGIPAELRRGLAQDVTAILQDATAESAGGVWLRRRAARCLALLSLRYSDVIPSGVGNMLGDIVSNDKLDLALRCDAAYTLGTLQDRAISPESVQTTLLGMGELAMQIISDAARQAHPTVPSAEGAPADGTDSSTGQGTTGKKPAPDAPDAPDAQAAADPAAPDPMSDVGDESEQTEEQPQPAESDDPFAPEAESAPNKQSKKKTSSGRSSSDKDATTAEVHKVLVRTFSYRLVQVRLGLEGVPTADGAAVSRGLTAAAPAPLKPVIADLVSKLKAIEAVANASLRGSSEEFVEQLLARRRELEQWRKANAGGQPAAAGAAAAPQKGPVAAAQ